MHGRLLYKSELPLHDVEQYGNSHVFLSLNRIQNYLNVAVESLVISILLNVAYLLYFQNSSQQCYDTQLLILLIRSLKYSLHIKNCNNNITSIIQFL